MRGRPREFDRDAVLEKAMMLFWRQGYEATSVADLVDELGIGRQSLYGAFGDKKQLFDEAFSLYVRSELEPFLTVLEGPGTATEKLRMIFGHIRVLAAREPQRGCMAVRTAAAQCECETEMAVRTREQMSRLEDAMTRMLREAVATGELYPDLEPRALARTLLSTFNGMAAVSTILEDPPSMAEDVLRTLEALLLAPAPS